MLRAPVTADVGLADYSARDEFNQAAGNLVGKVAPVGGTWAGVGDADDFAVETAGKTAQRTAVSDAAQLGRADTIGSSIATQVVQVDVRSSLFFTGTTGPTCGAILRFVDSNNYATVFITFDQISGATLGISTRTGGVGYFVLEPRFRATNFTPAADTWYTVRALVDPGGWWAVWLFLQGGQSGAPVLQGWSSLFATGGTLASGTFGLFDYYPSATAATRSYDNFLAWVSPLDAVLHSNQSAQLGTDGTFREDSTGTAYGPVSHQEGGIPRMPPGGMTQVFLKGSRGDFDQRPDLGIDNISARAFYRPSWLIVPG